MLLLFLVVGAGHEFQYTPNNQPADKSFVVDLIRQTVQQLDDCHKRLVCLGHHGSSHTQNSGASSSPDPSSSVGLAKSTLVTDKSAQATITGLQANSGKNKQWCGVRYAYCFWFCLTLQIVCGLAVQGLGGAPVL